MEAMIWLLVYAVGWFVTAVAVYRATATDPDDMLDQGLAGVLGALLGIFWPIVLIGFGIRGASRWIDRNTTEEVSK